MSDNTCLWTDEELDAIWARDFPNHSVLFCLRAVAALAAERERERCAGIAEKHIGNAARERRRKGFIATPEIADEERGEDIAAEIIAKAIRSSPVGRGEDLVRSSGAPQQPVEQRPAVECDYCEIGFPRWTDAQGLHWHNVKTACESKCPSPVTDSCGCAFCDLGDDRYQNEEDSSWWHMTIMRGVMARCSRKNNPASEFDRNDHYQKQADAMQHASDLAMASGAGRSSPQMGADGTDKRFISREELVKALRDVGKNYQLTKEIVNVKIGIIFWGLATRLEGGE